MAARIAASQAWAASAVGAVWVVAVVAGAVAAAIWAAVGCCEVEGPLTLPMGLTGMRVPGSREVPLR
jgi:hypothetical protein